MNPDWVLIADASGARLFQQLEEGAPYALVHCFEHRGGPGSSSAPRIDAHPGESLRFAGELADFLEAGAQHGLCGRLRVFAPRVLLGELNAQIGNSTRRLLAGTHAVDLAAVDPAEFRHFVGWEIAPAG